MTTKGKKSTLAPDPKDAKAEKPPKAPARIRLDELLMARGLADDPVHAKALIMAGKVVVEDQRVDKPGVKVSADAVLRVKEDSRFVSRGGDKLWSALADLGLAATIKDKVVLDVGASTGGFTHCCLELGAKHVIALDVGVGHLAWELRQDARVTVLEKTDVRMFDRDAYPPVDLVVADVSFNSLARLAPALRRAAPRPEARFLVLIKPQFELPRSEVPVGGVVADPAARERALASVRSAFAAVGLLGGQAVDSRVSGRAGNLEIFYFVDADSGRRPFAE